MKTSRKAHGATPDAAQRAVRAQVAGDRPTAVAAWRDVLARRSKDATAHDALARLLVADDLAEAAVHALAAWQAAPGNGEYAANAWQLFTHMGEAGEVERFRRRVAERNDCVGLIGLGNALRRSGEAVRAERTYREALARFPEVSFTLSRLACLCAEQHRLDEADALFQAAAGRHGGRDVVTRTAPSFLAALQAGPAAPGQTIRLAEGPRFASRPILVYVSCDAGYFRLFGPSMIRSVATDSGLDAGICLHVVNPDGETEAMMRATAAAHDIGRFALISEQVDLAPLGAQAKTYYACSRFLLLPDLLVRYRRPMLMLDIDLMAIRDLAPLLATSAGADFGMMTNALKRLDIWSLLYADVVHISPTQRAVDFLDLVRRYIGHFLKPGTAHWFLDQAALAGAFLAGHGTEAAPRFVWYPTDIHSSTVMVDADGRYWTDDSAYFYSVRATGGGQKSLDRLKRRAGTIAELRALQPALFAGG
ncbi:tetratricopeptide repeat protein [Azospirillum sp.]|uniref:tetratricopeptide repeat protein n=1 Tax=Azospirillum sp. TaxID=34012 RepID=UPI003D709A2D